MAEQKKLTTIQRINRLFGTDTKIPVDYTRRQVNKYTINNPDIIFATHNKDEYDNKALELKQDKYLKWRWRKANYELDNQQYLNVSNVVLMYRDADLMDGFPEIGAALDIYSEETTYVGNSGKMVNVESKSERIKKILEDLLYNRLQINMVLPMISRSMCKYGNTYMLFDIDINNGIKGWRQLPVYEMERYDGMTDDNPYKGYYMNPSNNELEKDTSTKFVWVGENEFTPYWNWQIAHFRLLYDSIFLPYGCIVGDSRIETENGYKEIQNIEIGDKVYSFNPGTQEKELSTVTMMMAKGYKDVYGLETRHNFIEATKDHKFLIYDRNFDKFDYKALGEIEIGDLLVIDNSTNKHDSKIKINKSYPTKFEASHNKTMAWWKNNIDYIPDYVDEKFAKFFGFMLGDGWVDDKSVYFSLGVYNSINKEFVDYLRKITNNEPRYLKPYRKIGNLEYTNVVVSSKTLSLVLRRMGFHGKFNEKRIPEWIYSCNDSIKKAFLDGLMLADGSYDIDKFDILRCNLEMSNEQLVKDAKRLAQDLGYKTSLVKSRNRIGKQSKLKNCDYVITSRHESYYFYFYESFNKQERKYDLIQRLNDGFKTEKVTKIYYNGVKPTFDITVENENSNFFANGIVTHNCSLLNKSRRHWRMLSMTEDLMLMYRLERSWERRVYKINVGNINEDDVPAYIDSVANEFKRTPVVDPLTGQLDLRKNVLGISEDVFLPVRTDDAPNPIDTLPAAQNLTAIDDIKYILNKVLTGLAVPKPFINMEEATGDGKNLSLLDVRFARRVNKIQQCLLIELNKACIVHLAFLGFTDDLTNFTLSMNNPSSQAEMLELENLAKKITTVKDAVMDNGNGIPIMSMTRAWKEILGWSEKEIADNLEELRLEAALGAELKMTNQIIKRTGIFDKVDNIYGEAGAQYNSSQDGGQDDGGGMPGGGGGGAAAFGGDMDMGMPEGEDIEGAEGDMDLGDMAAEEGGTPEGGGESAPSGGNEAGGQQQLAEAFVRNMKRKLSEKKKAILDEKAQKTNHYRELLEKRYEEWEKGVSEQVPLYDKTFLVNEEINSMSKSMDNWLKSVKAKKQIKD